MKNKGFTLIELLAVIVILAVIALVATPMVLDTIEDAKKGAANSSAYTYVNGIETSLASYMLNNNGTSYTTGKHSIESLDTNLGVKIKGDAPSEGIVCIENNTVTKASLKINGYIISYDGDNATTTDLSEIEDITCDTPSDEVVYKCRRATVLHTETCEQTSSNCYAAGYTASGSKKTTTITYGNENVEDGVLTSGDAFDCDVDGTGYNHRFYYVSDLYNTTTKTFDNDYAVLVYYNNTTSGVADNGSTSPISYDSSGKNYQGPVTAIVNLPTTTQWNNVSLSNTSRVIVTETGAPSTSGGSLPTDFNYSGYAARFLTAQEINSACGIEVGSWTTGELDSCNYLMENTKYSSSTLGTYGYWLETPLTSTSYNVWLVYSGNRNANYFNKTTITSYIGVRPTIEILKSEISY